MYFSDLALQLLVLFCLFWILIIVAGVIMATPGKRKKSKHEKRSHDKEHMPS